MALVNIKYARKKFHASDRLELHPRPKSDSSIFFSLGELLPNGPREK